MESVKSKFNTDLKVWEKIHLVVGEGRQAGVYVARVEDILNGGIVVTDPEFLSGHTLLRDGVAVDVQITRDDAAYQFRSRVRLRHSDDVRRVILSPPRGYQRIQRRMFARVELPVKVGYAPITPGFKWADWEQQLTWYQTDASDISAGGVLIRLPEPIEVDSLVVLQVGVFPEADLPRMVIAGCRRTFKNEEQPYAGLEFVLTADLGRYFARDQLKSMPGAVKGFDRRAQDRLVTFLFRKQIELRQKGLI